MIQLSLFKKMPVVLGLVILLVILGTPYLPFEFKSGLYALSLTIKTMIILVLPIIIFGLLFRAAVLMARKATWIVGIILCMVCASTFLATYLGWFVGLFVYHMDSAVSFPQNIQPLVPLWDCALGWPSWMSNDKVMLSALVLGVLSELVAPQIANRASSILDKFVTQILSLVTWIIPPFVAGFVVKLSYEGVVGTILKNYSFVFICIAVAQFSYLFLLNFLINGGSIKKCLSTLQNNLPAAMSGFTTMSSAASIPLLITGVEKNTHHKELARMVVPSIVNIHMIGECFTCIILAFAVLKTYSMPMPTPATFFMFSVYFFIARFSVAAVPGGGILVIYAILRQYFGFTDDMISMITALYILFDPLLTTANVLGDGIFAQAIDRIIIKLPKLAK